MNANLRDYYGATVLTNEAIEVHLSYLRPAVEAVQGDIEALDRKLNDKIDALDRKFGDKIDALERKFGNKIDALNEKFDGKIDKLIEQVSQIRASQDGLKWFVGSLTLLTSGISIARSLGWI